MIEIPGLGNVAIPKPFFHKTLEGRNIYIFPGWKFLFGYGCKWFRFRWIVEKYKENHRIRENNTTQKYKSLILQGNFHGNYLAGFVFFSYLYDIPMDVYAYTWDRSIKSANSYFVKKFSKSLQVITPREWKNLEWEIDLKHFVIPKFGDTPESRSGLDMFWEFLEVGKFANILMDIGSGVSYLSLADYKKKKNIQSKLWGISLGESRKSFLSRHSLEEIEKERIVDPCIDKGYNKTSKTLNEFIQSVYNRESLPLEPIYSAKTYYTLQERVSIFPPGEDILYVHQGGNLNWLGKLKL